MFSTGLDYFFKGGFMMYPLLLCSMAVLVIAAERFMYYKKNNSDSNFVEQFCDYIMAGDWTSAKELADNTKGELGKFATIVMQRHGSIERLEDYMAVRAEKVCERFEENLSYLNIAVSLAPVMGLLGTVTGMIGSFNALDVRVDNPMAVTAGIGEALITTVFGLGIAIVGICVHGYFSKKLRGVELSLEELSNTLMEAIVRDMCDDGCDHNVQLK